MKFDIIEHDCIPDGHGWSVNESYCLMRGVEIVSETDEGIFKELKAIGVIAKGIHFKSVEITGDCQGDIYVNDIREVSDGFKPVLTLRGVEHAQ